MKIKSRKMKKHFISFADLYGIGQCRNSFKFQKSKIEDMFSPKHRASM